MQEPGPLPDAAQHRPAGTPLPCDDAAAGALAAALDLPPVVARLLCQRGLGDPGAGVAVPQPVARPPARSDAARRHARSPSIGSWRRSRARSGSRSTATTTWTASRRPSSCAARLELLGADVDALHPRAPEGRLRAAAGGDRSAARRRRRADHLGRLRHPRRRGGASRARARRRSDHHRPPRAGRRAAAGARRDQPEAARLHAIPTSTSPASAWR